MNCLMTASSCSLPAIPVVLLHVGRRSARARACRGIRMDGGLGGGVSRERLLKFRAGVEGEEARLEVDA